MAKEITIARESQPQNLSNSAIYTPKRMTVNGRTGWFAVTRFNGEEWPAMIRNGVPREFISEEAARRYSEMQNYMNRK